jgi:hypothetical protein
LAAPRPLNGKAFGGLIMKWILILLTVLGGASACAHHHGDTGVPTQEAHGIDFSFFPPVEGFRTYIPLPTRGACGLKGVFSEAMFGVLVDSVIADGRPVESLASTGNWDSVASPLAVTPDSGFTFLVSHSELGAHFFEWSEKRQAPGFMPPLGGPFRGNTFKLAIDGDKPEEIVIQYRVRCVDMTLSQPMVVRGRNDLELAKESRLRWSRRTSR